MNYDPFHLPFPSTRSLSYARHGAVATSHPLAAAIGLDILKAGGNAVDAAIATAASLAVLEPTSNGLGSDCFALVHDGNTLHGLNASGWSPEALTTEALKSQGKETITPFGWDAVTVPGAMAGWHALSQKFGTLGSDKILEPLVGALKNGVVVPPMVAYYWNRAFIAYSRALASDTPQFAPWFSTFAPGGKVPKAGDLWYSPDQVRTLEILQKEGFLSLYTGTLARNLVEFSETTGGHLSPTDLAEYAPQWVDPISMAYHGVDVWEIPPNGQGVTALMALGMRAQDSPGSWGRTEDVHNDIESIKLAFSDTFAQVTDPRSMVHTSKDLLDPSYLRARRALLGPTAGSPTPGQPPKGGTVYLTVADSQGMMVSLIQSNYMGFGSGLVVPGTGVALQNRGHNFTLDPKHPNRLEGRKRPYHTIIPGFLTENGQALAAFGIMGGFMQPQAHLQVVRNLVDYDLNPQAALDAPRWQWMEGKRVSFEPDYPLAVIRQLESRGHLCEISTSHGPFGRGQMILKDLRGVYVIGTEKRCDSGVSVY